MRSLDEQVTGLHKHLQHLSTLEEDHQARGSVLVRWVAVCDFMTPDGDRYLQLFRPTEMPWWEANGLLQGALDRSLADEIEEEG